MSIVPTIPEARLLQTLIVKMTLAEGHRKVIWYIPQIYTFFA